MSNNSAWGDSKPTPPRPANYNNSQSNNNNSYSKPPTAWESSSTSAYGSNTASSSTGYATAAAFTPAPGRSQKEIELDQREAELFARERRLAEREKNLGDYHPPNWPSCRPLVYHDIHNDIPKKGQYLVKRLYVGWFIAVAAMLMNSIASLALLIVKAEGAGNNFGISLAVFILGTPVSFVFWYQPLYRGVKRDRSLDFVFFFFNYFIHLGAMGLFAVGIPGWGGAGVIYTISNLSSNPGAGIICIVSSSLLIFDVIYGIWQLKAVHDYWRKAGMSTDKAQAQANIEMTRFGTEVVKKSAAK